jgi:hypothetical protein
LRFFANVRGAHVHRAYPQDAGDLSSDGRP